MVNGSTTLVNATAKYGSDQIKNVKSIQVSSEFTKLYARGLFPSGAFLPNSWNQLGSQLAVEYFPSVGVEYEGRFQTANKKEKGNVVRGMAKLNVSIYPLSTLTNNSLELFSTLQYRHDLLTTIDLEDRSHPSTETGLNVVLFKNTALARKISLCFSYNNTDNPALGKEK